MPPASGANELGLVLVDLSARHVTKKSCTPFRDTKFVGIAARLNDSTLTEDSA